MSRPALRKLLASLFGASIALNLVLAGWLATHPRDQGPPSIDRIAARMTASLPSADRPAFTAVLEAERPRYAPAFAEMRRARRAVDEAIQQRPFDPMALRAAMLDWNRQWSTASDTFSEALVNALSSVTPEGRTAFIRNMPRERD